MAHQISICNMQVFQTHTKNYIETRTKYLSVEHVSKSRSQNTTYL